MLTKSLQFVKFAFFVEFFEKSTQENYTTPYLHGINVKGVNLGLGLL